MEKLPERITVCRLQCVLMPQGEVICEGKTIEWFKDLKRHLETETEANSKLRKQTELSEKIKLEIRINRKQAGECMREADRLNKLLKKPI